MIRYFCDWCGKEQDCGRLDQWQVKISLNRCPPNTVEFIVCFECSIKAGLRKHGGDGEGIVTNHRALVDTIAARMKTDAAQ